MPLGDPEAKKRPANAQGVAIGLYSPGVNTSKDQWLYAFDRKQLEERVEGMIAFYEQRRQAVAARNMTAEQATTNDRPDRIKWSDGMKQHLQRNTRITFDPGLVRVAHYRPFIKRRLYYDPTCIERVYRTREMFPAGRDNQVFCVTGRVSSTEFSVLIADSIPDLNLMAGCGQAFPRWAYPTSPQTPNVGTLLGQKPDHAGRVDNITDWCLDWFRSHYNNPDISKDQIWAYIYGVLHAPDWRNKYANDLSKGLPRIPFAPDLQAFQHAGQKLIDLHLGYETSDPYPLNVETDQIATDPYRIGPGPMRWGGPNRDPDRSVLVVNDRCRITGVPDDAHQYTVNGKTPLEWAIDRLKPTVDNDTGHTNDPNTWHTWANNPEHLITHLQQLVRLSIETTRTINTLPPTLT